MPKLLQYSDPSNLAAFFDLQHTRFTYHRTWETGLEAEIRVAVFSPDFFVPKIYPRLTLITPRPAFVS